ncbi:uncharacterized protein RCH25_052910 [Pelodytes ibericus]
MDAEGRPFGPELCPSSEDIKPLMEYPQYVSPLITVNKEEPVEWLISDVRSLAESQPEISSSECIGSASFVLKVEQYIKEESDMVPIAEVNGSVAIEIENSIKKEDEEESPSLSADIKKESELSTNGNPLKQEVKEESLLEEEELKISEKQKPKSRRSGRLPRKAKQSRRPPSPDQEFFKCETCEKVIKHIGNFREHQRIHTGERPYKCKTCKKNFIRCADLIKHQLVHSNRRPHKCKTCGKKFKLAGDLSKHSQVHSDKFPFKCESCDKSFKRTACLIKHMRIHTEEKPFPCPICGKRFKWESSVREHRRIHTGEKPFKCPECKKKFTHFSTFQQHKRTHKENAAFSCDRCDKSYNHKSNLLKHQRSIHK